MPSTGVMTLAKAGCFRLLVLAMVAGTITVHWTHLAILVLALIMLANRPASRYLDDPQLSDAARRAEHGS
jgi:hypothetical protein